MNLESTSRPIKFRKYQQSQEIHEFIEQEAHSHPKETVENETKKETKPEPEPVSLAVEENAAEQPVEDSAAKEQMVKMAGSISLLNDNLLLLLIIFLLLQNGKQGG
ncbi:MAG: hypothetical protein GX892_04985 [Thermoanaerobacteraceae bacterium]|nr:hypothetical protein [Thermoanaerobacteraceae bacterium]